jgi:hypothetical protein
VVSDAVVRPLGECADVVRHPSREKKAELLQGQAVLGGKGARIGTGRVGLRSPGHGRLGEGSERKQWRRAVLVERHKRALFGGRLLDERISTQLELTSDGSELRPAHMAADALEARLAREAWQRDALGRRGAQAEDDRKET